MELVKINISKVLNFFPKDFLSNYEAKANIVLNEIKQKTGKGNDFLGWIDLPSQLDLTFINDIQITADKLRKEVDVVVVIGIGGSYLGAKAVIEALKNNFNPTKPEVLFAGQNLCEDYLAELLDYLENKSFAIVVISKSGTTTEPAIAFRLLKNKLEEQVGKQKSQELIIAITDAKKGALKQLSINENYKTFVIADDIGGRYSVLTPVGLLPIAIAGFDITELANGAKYMQQKSKNQNFDFNTAIKYAITRNALYDFGKSTEILISYTPKLIYLSEWWKQLYGESEGKEFKGLFPASVNFTTDLHSMGQYIQEGKRMIFETVISVAESHRKLRIPKDDLNLDNLNYLAGKRINEVNKKAELGTLMAHLDGGVPNIKIEIPAVTEYYLGALLYFFEIACAYSGYLLGVNPFDQPGVEEYKKNMFKLLKKPGY